MRTSYYLGVILLLISLSSSVSCLGRMSLTKISLRNTHQSLDVIGYVTTPTNLSKLNPGTVPAVIILHGCAGAYSYSNPYEGIHSLYREWSSKLSSDGYIVLLIDSFTTRKQGQRQCGNGEFGTSEVDDRPYDVKAGYEWLLNNTDGLVDKNRIGLMGWSHGGSTTLTTLAIFKGLFQCAISFYPGCGFFGAFGGLYRSTWTSQGTPVTLMAATLDSLWTDGNCKRRFERARLLEPKTQYDIQIYEGAHHSFDEAKYIKYPFTTDDLAAKSIADKLVVQIFTKCLKYEKIESVNGDNGGINGLKNLEDDNLNLQHKTAPVPQLTPSPPNPIQFPADSKNAPSPSLKATPTPATPPTISPSPTADSN